MRLQIIAVGRLKPGALKDLEQLYLHRLTWPVVVREVEERRPLPAGELKEREAALLLAAVPKDATVVALDERGTVFSSAQFADRLAHWRDHATSDIAFLLGGASGLAESARRSARLVLSLGPMTWPHFLARGMLLEQLYRAQQILSHHPYHRDG